MNVYDEDEIEDEDEELGDEGLDDLGPDERDADLMDGSWERQYYARQEQADVRDWRGIYTGIALLLLAALIVPLLLAVNP
jgi:hypothetical protein